MASKKIYKIKTVQNRSFTSQSDRESITEGTLDELIKYYSYTLEIGNSWNRKIQRQPKTIKSFVKHLQMSYEEKEAACYNRTYVELVD